MTAPEIISDQPSRREQVIEQFERQPLSLLGSWALYHADGVKTEQALVVGEPNVGTFLLEVYDLVTDKPREQRLVDLETLRKRDDDGGSWTFYDDHDAVRKALTRVGNGDGVPA